IEPGDPGGSNFLVFNNGNGRIDGNYSSVDEFTPPVDTLGNYSLTPGSAYGPTSLTWTYNPADPDNFYAANISGADRLSNGNTLICNGPYGAFLEVASALDTVWLYINPVTASGILTQGDEIPTTGNGQTNRVFRVARYGLNYAGFEGHDLTPGDPIELYDSSVIYVDQNN
ncbi:MAG: arylsulfotransferase (ASST), partial [Planctomycetes bacterium]|nr:arylsulfotransferase (ASST) [Planctomycetota bacterium]